MMRFAGKLVAYWHMLHPYTSLAVAGVTMLLAALPGTIMTGDARLWHIGLTMLLVQFSIGLSNDLLDQKYDALAKPGKPLIDGRAEQRLATLLLAVIVASAWTLGLSFGLLGFGVMLLGQACGLAYNLGLKRTLYAWVPHAIAAPTILVWVRLLNGSTGEALLWIYPLGLIVGPALNIANQLLGAEASGASGERSLVHLLGAKWAARLAALLFAAAGLLMMGVIHIVGGKSRSGQIAVAAAVVPWAVFILLAENGRRLLLWPLALAVVALLGYGFHVALPF